MILVRPIGTMLWLAVTTTTSAFSLTTVQWSTMPQTKNTKGSTTTITTWNLGLLQNDSSENEGGLNRGTMIHRSLLCIMALGVNWMGWSTKADAKYGAASNMELPNYIEYLVEKNQQQQGNGASALYQGADPVVLLQRLQDANQRLQEIPSLATVKKWSQIQGLLTGPLGTLSQTLNQLIVTTSTTTTTTSGSSSPQVQQVSKTIKADLIAIGQAATQKNGDGCIAMAKKASDDLKTFLELIFDEL